MQPFAGKHAGCAQGPEQVSNEHPGVDKANYSAGVLSGGVRASLRKAEDAPSSLSDTAYAELLGADGDDLDALCTLANAVRRDAVGDEITFVVNRNLDTAAVGGGDRASYDLVDALIDEAWALGATEICVQGPLPVGAEDNGYLALVGAITRRAPGMHVHAFRPGEIIDGAARLGISPRSFLQAAREGGLCSVPGTAARILDDGVRTVLLGGPDLPVATWIDVITTAHEAGLPSTATMVYGHVETPAQQVAHLRTLATIQDRTGGFTELIPMPHVPRDAPVHLVGVARPGPTTRETRAIHAVARLMLHGRIDHVQAAWTKLGLTLSQDVLCCGADDLGGLLVDGEACPTAGQEAGLELTVADVERLSTEIARPTRQRTTLYGNPTPERVATAREAQHGRIGSIADMRAGAGSNRCPLGSGDEPS